MSSDGFTCKMMRELSHHPKFTSHCVRYIGRIDVFTKEMECFIVDEEFIHSP